MVTPAAPEAPSSVVRLDTRLRVALKADAAYRDKSMRAHLDDIVSAWLKKHGNPHTRALLREVVP